MQSCLWIVAVGLVAAHAAGQCPPDRVSWLSGHAEDVVIVDGVAIIAQGNGGLHTVDVSDPAALSLIGKIETEQNGSALAYRNGLAYVAGYTQVDKTTYRVVDVSDPSAMSILGELEVDVPVGGTRHMELAGDLLYAVTQDRFHIVDVSDVTQPSLVASYPVQQYVRHIRLRGDLAYLSSTAGILIYDVSDPLQVEQVGAFDGLSEPWPVLFDGDLAYVASKEGEFGVLDVSDPVNPALISKLPISNNNYDLVLLDGDVYVSGDFLRRINVDDPAAPYVVVATQHPGYGHGLAIDSGTAFVASSYAGFYSIDLESLEVVGDYSPPYDIYDLDFHGDIAYTHDLFGGHTVDYSDPANPVALSWFEFFDDSTSAAFLGDIGYFDASGSLIIADVSDPQNVSAITTWSPAIGSIRDLDIRDGVLYITGRDAIVTADLADPLSPMVLDTFTTPIDPTDLQLDGDLAYVTRPDHGLMILDVADPASLELVGLTSIEGTGDTVANASAVGDGVVCVAAGDSGFVTVDVRDPAHPTVLDSFATGTDTWDVVVDGSVAYVAHREFGTLVFDVTYPSIIKQIGVIPAERQVLGLELHKGLLYVAATHKGVQVHELTCVPCGADVNGDGEADIVDFVAFQLLWVDQMPGADCNDDGAYDVVDFACFQQAFLNGCD